jgi:molybdate transport system substrate-binding protein
LAADRETSMTAKFGFAAVIALLAFAPAADAADLKLLTTGAFKQAVLALIPDYERASGNRVIIDNDTAGGLKKRIDGGETFDVAIITPAAIEDLAKDGKVVASTHVKLANVGVGVGVKEGTPAPDISSVDAFRRALLNAKAVAYIDPKSGGSSGIYVDKLLERLGIAEQVRPKAKLKSGGYAADFVASGEADIVVQQVSEILPVKGVTFIGPLPAEIQNTTTYSGAVSAQSKQREAGEALLKSLAQGAVTLKSKGMQPAS